MNKSLKSITDENSILITAEFYYRMQLNKVAERDYDCYKLDLIVSKDATLKQLLTAIKQGINAKILNFKGSPLFNEILVSFESYMHSQEAEAVNEVDFGNENGNTTAENHLHHMNYEIDDEFNVNFANTDEEEEKEEQLSPEEALEKEIRMYLHCKKIFEVCYKSFMGDERSDLLDISDDYYQPSITLGFFDSQKIKEGEKLNESNPNLKYMLYKEKLDTPISDLGFITTSAIRFDITGTLESGCLIDKQCISAPFKEQAPHYNISDRNLIRFEDETVEIISPTEPPKKQRRNVLMVILTPLLMAGFMVLMRSFIGGASGSMAYLCLMTLGMSLVTTAVAIVNECINRKHFKEDTKKWLDDYTQYINRIISKIKNMQCQDTKKLCEMYPPVFEEQNQEKDLVSKALEVNGDIFSRGKEHPDFLTVRIGLSVKDSKLVHSVFKIKGDKKEAIYASIKYNNIKKDAKSPFYIELTGDSTPAESSDSGYLIDLPYNISKEYEYLSDAPVLISMLECRCLGIISKSEDEFYDFISNFIFDLCFNQSPDDVQCVMFCKENHDFEQQQKIIDKYKYLPHFRELLGDISSFAFNKDDAYLIFNKLLEILSDRKKDSNSTKFPHIIVFVLEEYDLKRHPVSEYFPIYGEPEAAKDIGISFVFCKKFNEELPKFCNNVIKLNRDDNCQLIPHTKIISNHENPSASKDDSSYNFKLDKCPSSGEDADSKNERSTYNNAYKMISALYYDRIAQGADVPRKVELFDIMGNVTSSDNDEISQQLNEYILDSWGLSDDGNSAHKTVKNTAKSLAVPIGKKASGIIELDLHEKGDGPHMLVAGTTGSGKTETVLTFLISLCANYTPEQVTLLLMDMKGAGFVQRIGDEEKGTMLPHVVGTVTDIAGDETGTGTVYMLKRFLLSMNAEVKRRKLLLNKMGVDSVDEYTKARANLKSHIEKNSRININDVKDLPPLPHLFLIIDEFTELMKFSADNDDVDFKKDITSLARIGRSLGFHIILISQNIEGAITDDIRVNSRARLCLKVATREASKEMIQTDLAASPLMPGNGRAYLLVGTGSRFEYFQSGYSGADISKTTQEPVVVTKVELTGPYSLFYDSSKPEFKSDDSLEGSAEDVVKPLGITQLKKVVDQIIYCFNKEEQEHKLSSPHFVFQHPLPNACYYDFDWTTKHGTCKIIKKKGNV